MPMTNSGSADSASVPIVVAASSLVSRLSAM